MFSALALGSVHPWSVAVCAVLAAGLFTVEVFQRDVRRQPHSMDVLDWALLAIVAYTALQIVPLPALLVKLASPHAYEIRAALHGRIVPGGPPAFMPLSVDVTASILALLKLTTAGIVFLAVRNRVRQDGSRDVLWCVAVSGLIVAIVSLVHRLTGWDKVYDLYEPVYIHVDPLPAPFLNSNHLSGALGLAAAATIGLAFDEENAMKRLSLVVIAGFTGGAAILTLSRGGIVCFVAGQILFIALRVWQRLDSKGRKPGARRDIAALPLALALGVASGAYVALRAIIMEFVGGDASKLRIWLDALPMVESYWLAGSGRGTFEMAYTAFQRLPNTATFMYPENFLANWIGEWGIPAGGLFLLGILAILVVGLVRPPRRARNAGALVAIFAIMVHNFFDFSLEILGVLLPFAVVMAVESVRIEMSLGRSSGRHLAAVPIPRWTGLAAPLAVAILLGAGLPRVILHGSRSDEARLKQLDLLEQHDDEFDRALGDSMRRHPADFQLPLLGGIRAFHTGRSDPLPLLARSLTLFPRSAVAHLYVARTLARAGRRDQSLVEYMEALRSRPALSATIAGEVIAMTGGFSEARKLARLPEDRLDAYTALADAYLGAGLGDEARLADVAALGVDPKAPGPLIRTIRRHMDAGLWEDARGLARRLSTLPEYQARALALEGEIEQRTGDRVKALELYRKAYDLNPLFRDVLVRIAELHLELKERDAMFAALDLHLATASDEREKGESLLGRASFEMRLGLVNQALSSYREAASSMPDEPSVWKAIATIHEGQGEPIAAIDAYKELARIEPENPVWREKLETAVAEAKTQALVEKP